MLFWGITTKAFTVIVWKFEFYQYDQIKISHETMKISLILPMFLVNRAILLLESLNSVNMIVNKDLIIAMRPTNAAAWYL